MSAGEVASGTFHMCTRTSLGDVRCWGRNDYGALGDGTSTQRNSPKAVAGFGAQPGFPSSVTITATSGGQTASASVTLNYAP